MQTGDIVRDDQGRSLQVGQLLGRGLWGRTYAARDEAAGLGMVIKVPHRASDLPDSTGALSAATLANACSEIALELGRLYEHGGSAALPGLHGRLSLEDGTPALVLPKGTSLEQRLTTGSSIEEVLRSVIASTKQLKLFSEVQAFHGNLKPTNLLVSDNGHVWLSDPVTPAFRKVYSELLRASRGTTAQQWVAPEVRESASSQSFGSPSDTYALSMVLFRAAMISPGHERYSDLPLDGLTKSQLVALKDRVLNRLKAEHSNPRFHTRFADRLSALLNRALSRRLSPSPPYRFRRLDEFGQRLSEVHAMVHPAVTHVGRLILDHRAGQGGFLTDEEVRFSASVACSPGVESHEEIACGLAVFDLDHDTRLRVDACSYAVDRHPSGRFRFSFRIGVQRPGGYRVRIAFTIRDSGDEPVTAEGSFRVRPAPGYTPPVSEPIAAPLPLRASTPTEEEARRTEPGVVSGTAQAPSAEAPVAEPASAVASARVQPVQRPAQVRAEPVTDPASADLPLPTPIAPVAPFDPPQRPRGRIRGDLRRIALTGAEEVADDPSTPAEDRLLLRPDARQGWRSASLRHSGLRRGQGLRKGPGRAQAAPGPEPSAGPRAQVAAPAVEPRAEAVRSPTTTPPSTFGGRPTTPPSLFGAGLPAGLGRSEPTVGPLVPEAPSAAALPTDGAAALKVQPEPDLDPQGPAAEHRPTEPMDRSEALDIPAAFTSLGRWSELPLPQQPGPGAGLPTVGSVTEVTVDPTTDDAFGQQGPVGALVSQLVETVRSDLYIMIIGSMALACAGLAFLLLFLKS